MRHTVLLVEDERDLATIVAETLRGEGFEVIVAVNGREGLLEFTRSRPNIVVADVMMPRMDGFTMVRKMRALDSDVPVLFLTARSAIDDIVEAFELGGNDYLKKPFKMQELIVRMRALLRRHGAAATRSDTVIAIGSYVFKPMSQSLTCGTKSVEMSYFESLILSELASHINQVVPASVLMNRVWQNDDVYNRNSLHGFIHKLRRLLRHDPAIAILNIRGIGYKLVVDGQSA